METKERGTGSRAESHSQQDEGKSETQALVARQLEMIERLAETVIRRDKAEASLAVVQRVLRQAEDSWRGRDDSGQACWCDMDGRAAWEEEHEAGCRAIRSLVRRLWAAMGEEARP
jgi:hypothetical protein